MQLHTLCTPETLGAITRAICRCAVANGKMQFENVAREWRCKWTDDGGGNAPCENTHMR